MQQNIHGYDETLSVLYSNISAISQVHNPTLNIRNVQKLSAGVVPKHLLCSNE